MCRHTFRKLNDAAGVPAITSVEKTEEKNTATIFVNGDEFAVEENRVIRVRTPCNILGCDNFLCFFPSYSSPIVPRHSIIFLIGRFL